MKNEGASNVHEFHLHFVLEGRLHIKAKYGLERLYTEVMFHNVCHISFMFVAKKTAARGSNIPKTEENNTIVEKFFNQV